MPGHPSAVHPYRPTHRRERHPHALAAGRLALGATRATATAAGWALLLATVAVLLAVGVGPRTGRYRTLTVLSGSMAPRIPVGALVVDTPEAPSQIRVGQVITYEIPVLDHHVISHRVVQILSGGDQPVIQTQGDANAAPDPWTAQVTGASAWRVRVVVPAAGQAIIWLRRPALHRLLVLGIPGLLAVLLMAQIWRAPGRTERRSGHARAYA